MKFVLRYLRTKHKTCISLHFVRKLYVNMKRFSFPHIGIQINETYRFKNTVSFVLKINKNNYGVTFLRFQFFQAYTVIFEILLGNLFRMLNFQNFIRLLLSSYFVLVFRIAASIKQLFCAQYVYKCVYKCNAIVKNMLADLLFTSS